MRKIQPETEEFLVCFQNNNPNIFVMFISLFFDLLFKEVINGRIFWRFNEKCVGL